MRKFNISEARIHLSRLVIEVVASGESFIITRSGKPMVKVIPVDSQDFGKAHRTGFLSCHISVPDDFDQMGLENIESDFVGEK